MQAYVSKLRRVFEPGRPRAAVPSTILVSRPGGYALEIPAHTVDLGRARSRAAEGARLLACGDLPAAGRELRQALAEWRGDARHEPVRLRGRGRAPGPRRPIDRPAPGEGPAAAVRRAARAGGGAGRGGPEYGRARHPGRGRRDRRAARRRRQARPGGPGPVRPVLPVFVLDALSELCLATGDAAASRALRDRLEGRTGVIGWSLVELCQGRLALALGDHAAAGRYLRAALDFARRTGATVYEAPARALLAAGASLEGTRSGGDRPM
ncbi:hypothetical protein AB0M95_06410 [Sphaerisporangium sp. NPDC051017]|uniref:AfsR/SARP family transcriptional regulator n=1 Tax=Sphaerisporangium sp. NPDC051017 TaxID=3154636 RepID=UPI00343B92A4